jgi:hypothetical protein
MSSNSTLVFSLVLADISDVVEDQQMVLVELGNRAFKRDSRRAICRRRTRSLVRVNSTRQPFSTSASPMADARWLWPPGGAEQEQIGAFLEPAVARGRRHHLRFADHRHRIEVEVVEGFARRQLGFGQMPLDAAATTIVGKRR